MVLLVIMFDKFIISNNIQFININSMLVTLFVLKFDKSKETNEEHS